MLAASPAAASFCERRVKTLRAFSAPAQGGHVARAGCRLAMAVRIRPVIDHGPASTSAGLATDAPGDLRGVVVRGRLRQPFGLTVLFGRL